MGIELVYKITESQASEILTMGNQTGFHLIPFDYGQGIRVSVPPDIPKYDIFRQYIAEQNIKLIQAMITPDEDGMMITWKEIVSIIEIIELYYIKINEAKNEVIISTKDTLIEGENLTKETIEACVPFYPKWETKEILYDEHNSPDGKPDIVQYNGKLWKVIQGHTTQADWVPDKTPALYKEIAPPGVIPVWVQPTGAHDAYAKGAKVTHKEFTWESLIDANVWEPGGVGTESLWKKL